MTPFDIVRSASLGIDGGVLGFTLVVTMATSFLFGLVPALHASRVDLIEALKHDGARSVTAGRAVRARGVLVVAEIALAFVLLTGAGLLMKSLMALQDVELGDRPENRLVMRASGVRSTQENTAYFREVLSRIPRVVPRFWIRSRCSKPTDGRRRSARRRDEVARAAAQCACRTSSSS